MESAFKTLLDRANSLFLAYQKKKRLVETPLFEKAFINATNVERNQLTKLLDTGTYTELKILAVKLGCNDLKDKPMGVLRRLGRKYGVKHYNNIPKTHLIEGIEDAIRVRASTGKTEHFPCGDEKVCPDEWDRRI